MMNNGSQSQLKQRLIRGDIRAIDFAFAEFIEEQYPEEPELLSYLAAHLSAQSGLQHVCVSAKDLEYAFSDAQFSAADIEALAQKSEAICCLSDEHNHIATTDNYPIVFQRGAFYLQRYWVYETNLLLVLTQLIQTRTSYDKDSIKPILEALFSKDVGVDEEIDWQKVAVATAALNPVTFITGGPGTGKTTTVVKLIALLRKINWRQKEREMIIKLAAPTGKAAARLSDSIANAIQYLPADLSEGLDIRCTTLHRLLGTNYQSIHFTHNQRNPLHADLVIIDEASMIDLPMMSKLFDAIPTNCQVVLLGDSEQLASVEVGTVLNDICALTSFSKPTLPFMRVLADIAGYDFSRLELDYGAAAKSGDSDNPSLINGIARLHKSHRFDANSEVGQLAHAVKTKDVTRAVGLLDSSKELNWFKGDDLQNLVDEVLPLLTEYCKNVSSGNLKQAFDLLKQQQVLCSHKAGRWGVDSINRRLESELYKRSLFALESGSYQGKPIMISRNSPAQDLFNGDIGIIAKDPKNNALMKAWFETSNGSLRGILINQLPEYETVFAMTVHKSQGSEFDKVVLCLPHERGRLSYLTRALLYTGLTRTKFKLTVCAPLEALETAMLTEVKRGSGLAQRLINNDKR